MGQGFREIFKNIQRTGKMKASLKIKLVLYRFFSTAIGRFILNLVSFGVNVKNLDGKNPKKHPFLVAVTVDTESGYVDNSERRVWQKEDPNAFVVFYGGIKNLLEVFEKHNIKSTFFISTQCFSARGEEKKLIQYQLNNIAKNWHETGLHLHPDSDFAIQKKLGKKLNATSAFFYNYEEKLKIIKASRELVKQYLGKNII